MSKNSKKKLRWLIPIAVLSATCLSAGMLAGCGGKGDEKDDHTHVYEWKSEGDEHWKECAADGVEEDGSRGPHVFVAGECECGATEAVVPKKYGKVTGAITLRKQGGKETNFNDVTVDMGDEVEPVLNKEAGTFTVDNVVVGKSYSLTVSKPGYQKYSVTVQVFEEGETVKVGGERGIVLEYEVFGYLMGWDTALHDFAHVNDANPYIMFRTNPGGKSFNVITNDSYKNVAATVGINFNNSTHNQHSHGLAIRFEDGKHIILRFHYNNDGDCGIQFTNALWGGMGVGALEATDSLLNDGEFFNKYGENWIYMFDAEEVAEVKGEEKLPLTAVLKDGELSVLYKNAYIYSCTLPEGYGDKKSQIAFWSWDGGSNAVFEYGITEQLPAMESALKLDVTQPEDAGCTVTATPAKEKYAFGEEIEIAVTAASGYKLDALTVNGKDMFKSLQEGKITILADRENVEVKAKFVEKVEAPLNLTVKGKKLGVTANLAKDTEVTLSGIDTPFAVNADGKITADSITFGRYTISVAGYFSQDITIDEELTEIVLEYDLLENLTKSWGWGDEADLSKQNDGIIRQKSGPTQFVSSKDSYDTVAISATLLNGGQRQGVFIRFKGEKFADDEYLMIQKEWDQKISWNGEGNLWGNGKNLFHETWTSYVDPYDTEEEYTVTLVRQKNNVYVFINGVYYDVKTLDAKYADVQCYVGVYCVNAPDGFGEQHFKIEENITAYFKDVTVNDGTEKGAHGSIEISPDEIKVGDTVTITVTPDADYILDTLTVSGGITPQKVNDTTYTFVTTVSEHTVTATFKNAVVTVTDATATDANGKVSFTSGKILLGNTVTITVAPDDGFMLESIAVADGDSKAVKLTETDGKYTFIAEASTYTVTATFVAIPAQAAEATVSGIGLGNTPVDFEGKTVTLTPETGTAIEIEVTDGKISRVLAPGKYTLSVDGYYDVEVTVDSDGAFEGLTDGGIVLHKILFTYNFPKEGGINPENAPSSVDYSKAASEGKLVASDNCAMYEWTTEEFEGDKAFTVTLKNGNGTQAVFAAFEDFSDGDHKHGVHYALEPTGDNIKVYVPNGGWYFGVNQTGIISWEIGNGEEFGNPISAALKAQYDDGTLTFTLAREANVMYIILGGNILGTYNVNDYVNNKIRFAVSASEAKKGYEIPFKIEDTSDVLARISTKLTDEFAGNRGVWTHTEGAEGARNTVAVSGIGNGLATFKQADTVKESLTFKLATKNASGDQGIMFRFANGKYVAVRFQGGSNNHIQYTCDTTLFRDNWLVGWGNDYKLTDEEMTAVNGDGLDVTYIRDGNVFYVYAGNRLLNVRKLDGAYADMKGAMSLLIWGGKGVAFEYEHKTGDAVTVPTDDARHSVNLFVKDSHGYDVSVDKDLVASGESVTLTIKTGSNWYPAWSYFPTSVKVNGEEKFVSSAMVSNGANRLTYTLTIENVTANTAIEVVIEKGTTIENGVVVTVKDEVGGTAESDSGANGYYWNDGCDIYMTPAGGYEIESITVDGGTPVTSGWTFDSAHNRYTYSLPDPIHEPVTVVVAYKVVETDPEVTATVSQVTDPTTAIEFGADITEDDKTYEVLAYERYGRDSESAKATATVDADNLMDGTNLINACQNVSGSFGSHGYAVSANDPVAEGSCFYIHTGTVDLKITKNVSQIRIYVGAWSSQTGTFTLKTKDGTTLATTDYANDGTENKNDVIIFAIDTTAFNDGDSVDLVLDFVNTTTDGTLPCAGIQILGEKVVTAG